MQEGNLQLARIITYIIIHFILVALILTVGFMINWKLGIIFIVIIILIVISMFDKGLSNGT